VRIVITGAGGRLGRSVVAMAMAQGHSVVAIDRSAFDGPAGAQSLVLDLSDYPQLLAAVDGADALIHLAAYISPDAAPEPLVHNGNVVSSYNALAAAVASGVRRVCVASSVNAVGGVYSTRPRYDYFPIDELHPCYAEDAYSLSKWIAELQAETMARRHPDLSVTSLRLHALRSREDMVALRMNSPEIGRKDLWGYTPLPMATAACLAALKVEKPGAQVCYVVAADTFAPEFSEELRSRFYPDVPVHGTLSGQASFFDSRRAAAVLGHLPS
jgi:nucleoside-diphosphate-sugar epimerase